MHTYMHHTRILDEISKQKSPINHQKWNFIFEFWEEIIVQNRNWE